MQILLEVILPVFILIGFGYLAVWRFGFPLTAVDGLMKYAQNFALPCLLFQAIAKIDLSSTFHPGLLFSFYTGAFLCFCIGILGARFFFKREWEDCIAIGFCCLFSNSLLLGLPITERAYGTEALTGNFAIVTIHSPFCYGIGITVMEITRNRGRSPLLMVRAVGNAMFHNALVIAIALGFLFNLAGLYLPQAVDEALDLIVRSALPVALFSLGGILIQYKPEGDKLPILMVTCIALLLHPALVWIFGKSLDIPQSFFQSGVLTAAMAPGINAFIFANIYGRARRIAASSILISTAGSIFTVWLWLLALGP